MSVFGFIDWFRYTDGLRDIDLDQVIYNCQVTCTMKHYNYICLKFILSFEQVEEMFDAASRYLLFPLKRAVADVLLPHLEMVSPAEMCHWLILSDLYVSCFHSSPHCVIHY